VDLASVVSATHVFAPSPKLALDQSYGRIEHLLKTYKAHRNILDSDMSSFEPPSYTSHSK